MSNLQSGNKHQTSLPHWVWVLLVSVAINGLLAGLLMAKSLTPKPHKPDPIQTQFARTSGHNNPRRLVKDLPAERRRQVLHRALKNLEQTKGRRPARLFKQRRAAKIRIEKLLRGEKFDLHALEKSLQDIRSINQELAVFGDQMMVEVLRQLTPEEREVAIKSMSKPRRARPNAQSKDRRD